MKDERLQWAVSYPRLLQSLRDQSSRHIYHRIPVRTTRSCERSLQQATLHFLDRLDSQPDVVQYPAPDGLDHLVPGLEPLGVALLSVSYIRMQV